MLQSNGQRGSQQRNRPSHPSTLRRGCYRANRSRIIEKTVQAKRWRQSACQNPDKTLRRRQHLSNPVLQLRATVETNRPKPSYSNNLDRQPLIPDKSGNCCSYLILVISDRDNIRPNLFENSKKINFFPSHNRSIYHSKSGNELPSLIFRDNRTPSFPAKHGLVTGDNNYKLGSSASFSLGFFKESKMPKMQKVVDPSGENYLSRWQDQNRM